MDSDEESVESWDGEALGEEECLFCSHLSNSLEQNVSHMTTSHSFFIPDIEYLADLPGLVTYLGQKVGEGHVCLWCNEKGKTFYSTKSVQQHMLDKGHTKMLHEGEAVFEYADFYDYRSSYPDFEEQGMSVAAAGGAAGGGDGEQEEEEVDQEVLDQTNFQLVLPSGSTVGHRSLQRYYRQKLKPTRVVTRTSVSNVISHYRALGWTGTTGAVAQLRAKDVAYVRRMRSRQMLKQGIKHNFQPHYRDQLGFLK